MILLEYHMILTDPTDLLSNQIRWLGFIFMDGGSISQPYFRFIYCWTCASGSILMLNRYLSHTYIYMLWWIAFLCPAAILKLSNCSIILFICTLWFLKRLTKSCDASWNFHCMIRCLLSRLNILQDFDVGSLMLVSAFGRLLYKLCCAYKKWKY